MEKPEHSSKKTKKRKSRPKINWLNHAIELVVVFLGISAGFILNNFREDQKDIKLEQQYLQGFYYDLISDYNTITEETETENIHLERALNCLRILRNGALNTDSAYAITRDMLTLKSFKKQAPTFETIISIGKFNVIRDYSIQEDIMSYYRLIDDAILTDKVFNDYMEKYALPYFFSNLDFLKFEFKNQEVVSSLEFKNIISGYYSLLLQSSQRYDSVLSVNRKLTERIQSKIKKYK